MTIFGSVTVLCETQLVGIVPPFQSRTIVVALAIAVVIAGVRRSPEARLIRIFRIDQLVLVLKRGQTRLDFLEFRRSHNVFLPGGKNFSNLLLRFLDAVWSRRMGLERLR